MTVFELQVLAAPFAVCRLGADAPLPDWARGEVVSLTRSRDELSVVCEEANLPPGVRSEGGWRCLRVAGPLDFSLVGVIASLTRSLADAGLSVFVISTFDTDYLLVKAADLIAATRVLTNAGHSVSGP